MAEESRLVYKSDGGRNVADIWNDAIRQYQGIGGKDLKAGYARFKSVDAMIDFGCKEMEAFHGFRYDGSKVSKLRGLFRDSMGLIEGGMQQVVAAATPAFPPAAAVGTALTIMLSACKDVGADYDVVTTFFVDFTMFLKRMKILENRLPEQGAFHDCVFDVFASLLRMCGIATRYIQLKRFKKWVSNLFKGGDPELENARSNMDKTMSNLHDATEKAILGNTVDLQRSSGETHVLLQQMEQELQQNSDASRKMMEEQRSMMQEIAEKQNSIYHDVKQLLQFEMDRRRNEPLPKQSGAKASGVGNKPPTSNSVRNLLGCSTDPDKEYQSLRRSLIPETGTWIFEEPEWKSWVEPGEGGDVSPILAVAGPRGTGKSHLAASIYDRLKRDAGENTCVAHFYFREDTTDLEYFYNAINWAVVQVAEQNATLCDRINKETTREDLEWDSDDWEDVWEHFLKPLFLKNSKYQLRIVLDGIDELPELVHRGELLEFLKKVSEVNINNEANIRIVCTLRDVRSDKDDLLRQLENIGITSISVTKEKQGPDTKALIWAHLNSDSGLKRFDQYIKQRIAKRIEEAADCMLYIEHMLRHFSMIGREPLVLKQLEQSMPASLEDCYDRILHGLEQRTVSSQREDLKSLLAWLSFSFRPLSLADSLQLLKTVYKSSLDLESELQGNQLARVLKIADRDEHRSSDNDAGEKEFNTDENPDAKYNDRDLPLKFQGRSMRDYFQQAKDITEGLRTPETIAHRKLFLVCCDIICGKIEVEDEGLRNYAAHTWGYHLSWTGLTPETNGDSIACLEGLGKIMTNANGAASFMQHHGVDYEEFHSDFADDFPIKDFEGDLLISHIAHFASLISNSDSDLLSPGTRAWAKDTIEDKGNAFVSLSKAHIAEWLQAADTEAAMTAYKFARSCIAMTGQNHLYKKVTANDEDATYDREETLGLPGAFGNTTQTLNAAWATAAILEHAGHNEDALSVISSLVGDLNDDTDHSDRFKALHLLAQIQSSLKDYAAAHDSITRALSLQERISPNHLRRAHITQARIYTNLERTDDAVKSYEAARQSVPNDPLKGETLRYEFDAWNDKGKALDLVRHKWSHQERLGWVTWNYSTDDSHLHDLVLACIDAKEPQFLVEVYQETIAILDHFGAGAVLRINLAQWYSMNQDLASMKRELYAILDSTLSSENSEYYRFTNEHPDYVLWRDTSMLIDGIYSQFRATADRTAKAQLFAEGKAIMSRPLAREVTLQKSCQVHQKLTLARMALKMGPLHEFEDFLKQAFEFTIDALVDDVSWNDRNNLESLCKILSCLEGLEWDAQIALSAWFSKLDPGDQSSSQANDADEDSDPDKDNDPDEDNDPQSENWDPLPDDEGDLTGYVMSCLSPRCEASWRAWKGRKIYNCLYCWDMILCEDCYKKRVSYDEGTPIPPGESFCGKNHKFLGPVDGWKGITNGIVTIEGREPFAFKDWLLELKEKKWPRAWENFWIN
ncbi:hypothetical protein KVR01_009616 [Diaporthe batatas]|uniref:uncharacterized protein n=1 Tax=Diaporthe batatas TaxID=748121 RepID=UPI001D03A25C|nr:uncharacterized protein KVR01_009616 [Diaporthe batatas]KAG8161352.1 hypothetical protein KVR01_009616 [Diaporthe batatas]